MIKIISIIKSNYYWYRRRKFNKPPPIKYLVDRKDGTVEFNFGRVLK